jgi:type II restriction enzyme
VSLILSKQIGDSYTSQSQKIRVITESWVKEEIYCPSCGGGVSQYGNNKPVADFFCSKCSEDFELKSKKGKTPKKIPAGAYSKMIERVQSSTNPNFFLMGYKDTWNVEDFFVVPKHFFVPEIIEQRKALSVTARRAGWVGSNILFSKIPKAGHIFYVQEGIVVPKKEVLGKWQKTIFLKEIGKPESKGWILDIMNCIDELGLRDFTLGDIYAFEPYLKALHPENNNIKAKIRQQLQILRDRNYLSFVGSGSYRLL